jgi:hypothetical protein
MFVNEVGSLPIGRNKLSVSSINKMKIVSNSNCNSK